MDGNAADRRDLGGLGIANHPFNPSRVPSGKATMHAWDYVPYVRADGRFWDDTKLDYAEHMIQHMGKFIDGLPQSIIQYHCDSPLDMERTSPSFARGDLHGVATTSYSQALIGRRRTWAR